MRNNNINNLINERDELDLYLAMYGDDLDSWEFAILSNLLDNLDMEIELSKIMTIQELEQAIKANGGK